MTRQPQGRDDRKRLRSTDWQPHIRNKTRREALAKRFRNPDDPLRMVLVRDMWLTGFNAPSLHTMYVDKPMRGHGLMQAIAGSTGYQGQAGGLVVDYIGLAHELKKALATYTDSGGTGKPQSTRARRSGPCWRSMRSAVACFTASTGLHGPPDRPRNGSASSRLRQEHHSRARERQGPLREDSARAFPSVRAGCPERRSDPHPRRRGVLSGYPGSR